MMTYERFIEETKEKIKDYLPDSYQDKEIMVIQQRKNNRIVLDGLCIKDHVEKMAPTLYLNPYYEEFLDGVSLDVLWEEMALMYDEAQQQVPKYGNNDFSYERLKKGLFVMVCNAEKNAGILGSVPHEVREDLALIYRVEMPSPGGQRGTMLVNDHLMNHWGITEEQLKKDAWDSMKEKNLSSFFNMNSLFSGMHDGVETGGAMYVLTNSDKVYGAVYMFDEEVMSRIAEKLDSDLIIIPSSLHEVIILRETDVDDIGEIRGMLRAINKHEVSPEDRLSNEIYRFDRESGYVQMIPETGMSQGMAPTFG